MKLILLLSFYLLSTSAFSQNWLSKYSYPLIGFDGIESNAGTCFFIKYHKSIYLVTAKHNVSGCDNDSTKSKRFPDFEYAYLGNFHDSVVINTNLLKAILPCNGVDLFVYKVEDTSKAAYINSIEDFITKTSIKRNNNVTLCGYPITTYTHPGMYPNADSLVIKSGSSTFNDINKRSGKIDSTMVLLNWNSGAFPDSLLHGYSGSPVFFKNGKTKNFELAGLFSAYKGINGNLISMQIIKTSAIVQALVLARVY